INRLPQTARSGCDINDVLIARNTCDVGDASIHVCRSDAAPLQTIECFDIYAGSIRDRAGSTLSLGRYDRTGQRNKDQGTPELNKSKSRHQQSPVAGIRYLSLTSFIKEKKSGLLP